MTDTHKVSIGFEGGQVLAVRLHVDALERLRKALPGAGWHELRAEDGTALVDLGKVLFIRTDDADHRVGFGL